MEVHYDDVMFVRILHYIRKFSILGSSRSSEIFWHRLKQTKIKTSKQKKVEHSWEIIKKKHTIRLEFGIFFESTRRRYFNAFNALYNKKIPQNTICKQAKFFAQNGIDLLGSGAMYFDAMPWHCDFRLRKQNGKNCFFDSTTYYKNISIQAGERELEKDIKIPWELSRFYHVVVLGKAYEFTGNKLYVQTFTRQITDWLDHNPYECGVNWGNPMEVALRVINWIVAFQFFSNVSWIELSFWQRFVCSLYDHMIYLENNWELYDGRTNNHYLANLVGYFYLCWFFADLLGIEKKRNWCHKKIAQELDWQVFEEGTSYEGSTNYHRFVTELFYHAYILCQEFGLSFEKKHEEKLAKMFTFIEWCKPNKNELITIGDNDSGRVLYYGCPSPIIGKKKKYAVNGTTYFSSFGLSVIKTDTWHVTLRHHAYEQRQPSGHFHNDVGSITLAINGVPIIIDPGTFVYTPSVYWRNYFCSVQVHNTFFLHDVEPVFLDNRLFGLNLPSSTLEDKVTDNEITMQHDLYKQYGLYAQRKINIDTHNRLIIQDQWITQKKFDQNIKTCWNFTLAPGIEVQNNKNETVLLHQQKPIAVLHSELPFISYSSGWISSEYGKKEQSIFLRSSDYVQSGKRYSISIELK